MKAASPLLAFPGKGLLFRSRLRFFFCLVFFLGNLHGQDTPLNAGINFYYQNKFDSALLVLKSFKLNSDSGFSISEKDSVSLFQYLGMASAKLGKDSLATENFSHLLLLDSLFRFPRNEDPAILHAFHLAQNKIQTKSQGKNKGPLVPENSLDNVTPGGLSPAPVTIIHQKVGFVYGAIPLGLGWALRNRKKPALALGILQVGGLFLSYYASERQNKSQRDANLIHDAEELDRINQWQWTQRLSLTTALGAYLYSIIASLGD